MDLGLRIKHLMYVCLKRYSLLELKNENRWHEL